MRKLGPPRKGPGSRAAGVAMAFKLIASAQTLGKLHDTRSSQTWSRSAYDKTRPDSSRLSTIELRNPLPELVAYNERTNDGGARLTSLQTRFL